MHLHETGVLSEPTLAVSPWFEARRSDYYDHLLAVSTRGDWDTWIRFFAFGLEESADLTRRQMLALLKVQNELKDTVRSSKLRADSALMLVDFAVANPTFTVRGVERGLGLSYGRANGLVNQLLDLEILRQLRPGEYDRRFYAPRVFRALVDTE